MAKRRYPTNASPNQRKILRVANRDGWTCHYCNTALEPLAFNFDGYRTNDQWSRGQPTLDHKQAISAGGRGLLDNLVLACWDCNIKKSNRFTYEQFYEMTAPLRAVQSETSNA